MKYTQEVIERIRATRSMVDQRKVGVDLAKRWISEIGTFCEIESIAVRYASYSHINSWIRDHCEDGSTPEIYFGFADEVRRFWGDHKHEL